MTLYRNTYSTRLDFPRLQNADGSGVSLEAGDTIEIDVDPVDVYDQGEKVGRHHPGTPWLVPVDDSAPSDIADAPSVAPPGFVASTGVSDTSPALPADK